MRILWLIIGIMAVALGAIGVLLPVMPTVPFLLLATYAFARSSDRLHRWILDHRIYGPPIRDWQAHGRIARRVKVIACLSMAVGFTVAVGLALPPLLLAVQGVILLSVSAYLITRPE